MEDYYRLQKIVFKFFLSALVVVTWITHPGSGHPQCLDFRAPFKPRAELRFCPQYSNLGCCSKLNEEAILEEYDYIRSKASAEDWAQCSGYVQQILCQKCSPYAAHIYDAEFTAKPRTFPGLCRSYCEEFYDKCKSLMWFLEPSLAMRNIISSRDTFCKSVALQDVDYCYPELLGNPWLNRNLTRKATTGATEGCLCLETVKADLANPLWARHAGDGSGRLFVAMQKGKVNVYNTKTKKWISDPFLDLTKEVLLTAFPGDERGFLGMAFHPNYADNGRFFLYYTLSREDGEALPPELEGKRGNYLFKIRISEMQVSRNNPNKADKSSEKVILEVPQPFFNHNGGELFFGIDGYLYASIGDGGAAGDLLDASQDKRLLLGKVVRLDVDSNPSQPYSIPPDNPFVNEPGAKPEIYAFGVRNIWRCGMDRGDRVTGANRGRVLCGDVGQNAYEEIDLLAKGANYGWNAREGFECFDNDLCGTIEGETLPIWAYDHKIGKSVTGGVFYRGCENPALNGQYIYGDYVSSRLFSLSESGGEWTNKDVTLCGDMICQGNLIGDLSDHIMSFGEDEDGEIYILTSKSSASDTCDGKVYKIVDPVTRNDPTICDTDLTKSSRVPLPKRKNYSPGTLEETNGSDKPVVQITFRVRPKSKAEERRRRRLRRKKKGGKRKRSRQSRRLKRKERRERKKGKKGRKSRKNKKGRGRKNKKFGTSELEKDKTC